MCVKESNTYHFLMISNRNEQYTLGQIRLKVERRGPWGWQSVSAANVFCHSGLWCCCNATTTTTTMENKDNNNYRRVCIYLRGCLTTKKRSRNVWWFGTLVVPTYVVSRSNILLIHRTGEVLALKYAIANSICPIKPWTLCLLGGERIKVLQYDWF